MYFAIFLMHFFNSSDTIPIVYDLKFLTLKTTEEDQLDRGILVTDDITT